MDTCPEQATYAIPWNGKIERMCDTHTRGIMGLAKVLGVNCFPEAMSLQQYVKCSGPNDLDKYKEAEQQVKNEAECRSICGENPKNHYFNCPLWQDDK